MLPPDFDAIPNQLRELNRWVCWDLREGRKVPCDAKAVNAHASSTDETTWASFELARAAYEERMGDADAFSGVGLVLNGDGLVGVDIDHCVSNGVPDPAALSLLDGLGARYVEVSPSGTGLRAFGYAESLETGCKGRFNGLAVELYSNARYLTVTGKAIKPGPISALSGFGDLARRIRADRKVDPETGEILVLPQDQRHAELVRRVLSGDVFHDSLRDLAASLVASGLDTSTAINHLYGLMDACAAPHDHRWTCRRAEIPGLVSSANAKFAPADVSALLARAQASNEPRYKLLTGADLAALPPLKWAVRGVLPAQGLAALYGPSGSGKSFLALDLFAAVGEGRAWFGHRVEVKPVVYVALEGEAGFKIRAEAWAKHHGRPLPDALRMVLQPFKLTEAQDLADLTAAILGAGGQGAIIVLDTLNRAAPTSDENSSKDMGEILEAAKKLQALTGGLVVLVHHTGKDATRGMRGHSSMFAALDASIEVTRDGAMRSWTVAKSKDGQDGTTHPFRLEIVHLGVDEYGDLLTSCVCVPVAQADSLRQKPLTPRQKEGLKALCRAAVEHGEPVDEDKQVRVHLKFWRAEYYRTSSADGIDAKRTAFNRVRGDLVVRCRVSVVDDHYYIDASDADLTVARLTQKPSNGGAALPALEATHG